MSMVKEIQEITEALAEYCAVLDRASDQAIEVGNTPQGDYLYNKRDKLKGLMSQMVGPETARAFLLEATKAIDVKFIVQRTESVRLSIPSQMAHLGLNSNEVEEILEEEPNITRVTIEDGRVCCYFNNELVAYRTQGGRILFVDETGTAK